MTIGNRQLFRGTGDVVAAERGRLLRLEPNEDPRTIEEGVEARVKDPLWFIGRQRQMGEFRARTSASVVRAETEVKAQLPARIGPLGAPADRPIDPTLALEAQVEAETSTTPPFWCTRRWAYSFAVETDQGARLRSSGYEGDRLDWFDFDLETEGTFGAPEVSNVKPSRARFPGAPHERFWALEDRRVDLGGVERPELNVLNVLLMEFTLLFGNDWHLVPLVQPAGQLRRLERLTVIDSFGFATEAKPAIDPSTDARGFEVFTLDRTESRARDGRLFYLPNTRHLGLEAEAIERVQAFRDEGANLVWAVEARYETASGEIVQRDEEPHVTRPDVPLYWDRQEQRLVDRAGVSGEGEPGGRFLGPVEAFEPQRFVPLHWIPFQALEGDGVLDAAWRRSRTQLDTSTGPQYKSRLIAESKRLHDAAVSRLGTRVDRAWQLVRTTDGRRHAWLGRKRRTEGPREPSGLRFDALLRR
jgi:hypothetical protein